MTIHYKADGTNWLNISQPWYALGPGSWVALKRVLYKIDGSQWKEVWPSFKLLSIDSPVNGINLFAAFGYPTQPATYIVVNNTTVGGRPQPEGDYAMVTGVFPAGSTLTIFNNGHIRGRGGDGASYQKSTLYNDSTPGGHALLLQMPTGIFNGGTIWGGGGGAGAGSEVGGSNDNSAPGGNGAGVPVGQINLSPWRPGYYYPAISGNDSTPGRGTANGYTDDGIGGVPGGAGMNWMRNIGSSRNYKSAGKPGGYAIVGGGYINPGSTGMGSPNIAGAIV